MARTLFRYNPETCKYEPIVIRGRAFWRRTIIFIIASYAVALAGLLYVNHNYPYWDEAILENQRTQWNAKWDALIKELQITSRRLAKIEKTDDQTFRTILDLQPLDQSMREAGIGGHETASSGVTYPLIRDTYSTAEKIDARLDIEAQSYDELFAELKLKEKKWASTPALQPISNKDLIRLHTTFGMRLHPILGYWREHRGLDLAAPKGAPVYATGDAYVHMAYYSQTYGQVLYLRHGFGYETRYAHLTKYIVRQGQRVQRGQVIGYVGTTGQSEGDHLHYEILYNGDQVNPMNFFHRYLSNDEYQRLIDEAKTDGPPLD
jgi:murein DD-endopeptidase MepM/ murein hydrolase activator NlpD